MAWKSGNAHRYEIAVEAAYRRNDENGSGYDDFDRYAVDLELRYESGPWKLAAEGGMVQYQYANRTVSRRDRRRHEITQWNVLFQASRRLTPGFAIELDYAFESSDSTRENEGYHAHRAGIAASLTF